MTFLRRLPSGSHHVPKDEVFRAMIEACEGNVELRLLVCEAAIANLERDIREAQHEH